MAAPRFLWGDFAHMLRDSPATPGLEQTVCVAPIRADATEWQQQTAAA
jgi:hypothetical protein